MIQVTCPGCEQAVRITPDNTQCSVCGHDLQKLIPPADASAYFYRRAADFAAAGDVAKGLAEVERGLDQVESAELRLLAAILAKRSGRYREMRDHVSAIPVDDLLRSEGEWLLRSHQARLRAQREGSKGGRVLPTESVDQLPPLPETTQSVAPAGARARLPRVVLLLATVLVVGGLAYWVAPPLLEPLLPWTNGAAPHDVTAEGAAASEQAGLPEAPAVIPATVAEEPTPAPTPTPFPTPTIPPDLAAEPTSEEQVASSDPAAVAPAPVNAFDWQEYLTGNGFTNLSSYTVTATLDGDVLRLAGFVDAVTVRTDMVAAAEQVAQAAQVDARELYVRVPPTYQVAEGDTLWSIVAYHYGDAAMLDRVVALNQDVLPSPELLRVGMVLQMPEIEQ